MSTVGSRGPENHPSVPRIDFASFALDAWSDEIIHEEYKGGKIVCNKICGYHICQDGLQFH